MTKFYQPNYALSLPEAQDDYIFWAYSKLNNLEEKTSEYYRRYFDAPWNNDRRPPLNPHTHYAQIEELFTLGKYVYQVLNCSFVEFKIAMLRRQGAYPGFYQSTRAVKGFYGPRHLQISRYREYITHTTWYDFHGVDYHEPLKYVRQEHHVPKQLTEAEVSQLNWREHKGFTKDYRRRHRGYASKRKQQAKKQSNRLHRQMERSFIEKERFDEIPTIASKYIFDSWMWD